jgi:phospho-N-acetylmuramoyl-pentapeptide-transferase
MLDKYFPLYIAAFLIAMLMTALLERRLIPILSGRAKQPIYKEGPSWHEKKSGTPTMGGLAFMIALLAAALPALLIFSLEGKREELLSLGILLFYTLLNACIGIADDLKKLKRKQNEGLTPMQKLFLQTIAAVLFLLLRYKLLADTSEILFSFGWLKLGWLYYPLSILMLLGCVNCANLTDGIDGLAASVAFGAGLSVFYISSAFIPHATYLSACLMGITVGFLCFNLHPAKIFMGDTGSLLLGALVGGLSFSFQNPLLIFSFGIVYIIEGVSVVLQVLFYKATKKRIFKMAPLHHHLEKSGWSENKICLCSIFLTLICSLAAYMLYLP